jgi:hypothetical protein
MKIILFCLINFSLIGFLYAQYFRAWEGKLYDANNQEFVIRGVNSAQVLIYLAF